MLGVHLYWNQLCRQRSSYFRSAESQCFPPSQAEQDSPGSQNQLNMKIYVKHEINRTRWTWTGWQENKWVWKSVMVMYCGQQHTLDSKQLTIVWSQSSKHVVDAITCFLVSIFSFIVNYFYGVHVFQSYFPSMCFPSYADMVLHIIIIRTMCRCVSLWTPVTSRICSVWLDA